MNVFKVFIFSFYFVFILCDISSHSTLASNSDEIVRKPIKDERIIGGRVAKVGERPYQVALILRGRFICGGSLIKLNIVLTAAHCIDGVDSRDLIIRYNTTKYRTGPSIQVKKIIPHSRFALRGIENDIALLVLSSSITPGLNSKIISLSTSGDLKPDSIVTVSGWGRISVSHNNISDVLLVTNLTAVARRDCMRMWAPLSVTSGMICAIDSVKSACNGDSGGPLTQNGVLIGVVSWGNNNCLAKNSPNVYTRINYYYSWIKSNLQSY